MSFKNVNEFVSGETIVGYYLVKSADLKTTSNNKKFMDFLLADKTGEINAKLWDCKGDENTIYSANMLVKVKAQVISWQNNLQLKVNMIRTVEDRDNVNIADYVPAAPYETKDMYDEIFGYINNMKNDDIKNIVTTILENKKEKLMHYPAAKKNHHSIRGGLLYHTLTMLKSGEKLCEIYTFLNKELLFAGIILHDMEKTEEMEASSLGIVSDYTVQGNLLGHIIQGINSIEKVGEQVGADKEVVMLLQHMILSHHYEPEYGSPKKPLFPEAEMLHHLDMIDARMYDMKNVLQQTEEGSFSDKVWSLENRSLYKSIYNSQE